MRDDEKSLLDQMLPERKATELFPSVALPFVSAAQFLK